MIRQIAKNTNKKLSKHFNASELKCRCSLSDCNITLIHPDLIDLLEAIRLECGVPVKITSGFRCLKHNQAVGGSPRSQHTLGTAADIKVKGFSPEQVAKIAEECGAKGIGVYPTFCHVDVRPGKPVRFQGK